MTPKLDWTLPRWLGRPLAALLIVGSPIWLVSAIATGDDWTMPAILVAQIFGGIAWGAYTAYRDHDQAR